jgi:multiple sugar transport system permease protein
MTRGGSYAAAMTAAYIALAFLVAFVIFPLYWMVITSFKYLEQMRALRSMFWPAPWTLSNYMELLTGTAFPAWFGNSALVAACSTLIAVGTGSLGAYAIVRLQFAGRALLSSVVLITYLVPPTILFIPLSKVVQNLGLNNSQAGLIVAYPTITVPFITWLLMGFFQSLPVELEQAAMIDGASRFGAFARVVLPLSAPGIVAAALFCFTLSWNEFLYALVLVTSPTRMTLPVGISQLILGDVYAWGQLMAASVLTSLPVVAFYTYLQRFMVEGLTAGGVRG